MKTFRVYLKGRFSGSEFEDQEYRFTQNDESMEALLTKLDDRYDITKIKVYESSVYLPDRFDTVKALAILAQSQFVKGY